MDMFNSVTSSVTNWWGKGIKKPNDVEKNGDSKPPLPAESVEEPSPKLENEPPRSPAGSDKSPPTSEADDASLVSQPEEDLPNDNKEKTPGFGGIAVDIEEVSTKAFQSAKNLGSFLVSVGKKAGKTVSDTAKHLKHTVEENSILSEFNKEQDAFVQDKNQQRTEAAVPPWIGYNEEEDMKQQILGLSLDRRNFLRSPPSGVSFQFNYDLMFPVAQATLTEDPNLEKMRFELVPKCINEENFWQNYFYRVSLIKQSAQLSSLTQETESTGGESSGKSSRKSSVDGGKEVVKKLEKDCKDGNDGKMQNELASSCSLDNSSAKTNATQISIATTRRNLDKIENDAWSDVDEIFRNTMIDSLIVVEKIEEEWERELQQELQEYEVVNEGEQQPQVDDAEWEKEIQKMLAAEDSNKNKP